MARIPSSSARRGVDPRLLIGGALVIASVAGVVGLVAALDDRTVVLAAARTLQPGDRVDRADLVERSVALDGADGLYLAADDVPDEGLVVTRAVRDGELLPRTAVGTDTGVTETSIVIRLAAPPSSAVVPGASVDVWATASGDEAEPPLVLVPDARIVQVLADDGLVSAGSSSAVEVLVPRSAVARVLQAQADGDVLAVVPAGLSLDD